MSLFGSFASRKTSKDSTARTIDNVRDLPNFALADLVNKDEIGRGGLATVFTAEFSSGGGKVVVKKFLVNGDDEETMRLILKENGQNLLLMGCPGAGKSTVAAIAAKMLGLKMVDFDYDILEIVWGMRLCDKLNQVGSEQFLEAEADIFVGYSTENSLVCLSGSNPMHTSFRKHAQSLGPVFYLDVHHEDILKYLNKKTEAAIGAIVGRHEGITWPELVEYRQSFYVKNYDVRIVCEKGEDPTSIAKKVAEKWKSLQHDNVYVSTRSSTTEDELSFLDVVIQGLAPDGGLYVPKYRTPFFTLGQWERLVELSYQERALRILEAWIPHSEIHPTQLQGMIAKAYENFQHKGIGPIRKLNSGLYLLELFHGPTASFKDMALQLTPQFFDLAANQRDGKDASARPARYLILVATSGDTGSAVMEGFRNSQSASVMVFYPEKGTSIIQRHQMTSMTGGNVKVVGLQGDFDFCHDTIKSIFNDKEFTEHLWDKYRCKLSAANSINWGRLPPQVVYHASAYLELVKSGEISMGDQLDVCIPTGNFGNILAAFYAKEMGLPYRSPICAANANTVLVDFFTTGAYNLQNRKLKQSISPSINILKSSNLERLIYYISKDSDLVRELFENLATKQVFQISEELRQTIVGHIDGGATSERQCMDIIKSCFQQNNYIPDPHTAVGLHVAQEKFADKTRKVMVISTAHYSKFAKDILLALGEKVTSDIPEEQLKQLEDLKAEPEMNRFVVDGLKNPEIHGTVCAREVDAAKKSIEDFLVRLTDKHQ